MYFHLSKLSLSIWILWRVQSYTAMFIRFLDNENIYQIHIELILGSNMNTRMLYLCGGSIRKQLRPNPRMLVVHHVMKANVCLMQLYHVHRPWLCLAVLFSCSVDQIWPFMKSRRIIPFLNAQSELCQNWWSIIPSSPSYGIPELSRSGPMRMFPVLDCTVQQYHSYDDYEIVSVIDLWSSDAGGWMPFRRAVPAMFHMCDLCVIMIA